ncbi:MAG: hypothetical protein WDM84_07750 [Bauldia sp.]
MSATAWRGVILAVDLLLVEFKQAREPDDRQEDDDEHRDKPAKDRLRRQQLLVSRMRQKPRVARDAGAQR